MEKNKIIVFWFRRDLRLDDNAGLARALALGYPVLPIFIFDEEILMQLEDKRDRRLHYIHQALTRINTILGESGATLNTFYGKPIAIYRNLVEKFDVQGVYVIGTMSQWQLRGTKKFLSSFKLREFPSKL